MGPVSRPALLVGDGRDPYHFVQVEIVEAIRETFEEASLEAGPSIDGPTLRVISDEPGERFDFFLEC
jgi:hypothetical protein